MGSQLQTMASTAQCHRSPTSDTAKDENGLILPRKIVNPCIQSPFRRDLNREIRWNTDKGINVLNTKSELEKAFAKHKKNLNEKKKEQETAESFTGEFQKMIAERARRLEKFEEKQEEEHSKQPSVTPNASECHDVKKCKATSPSKRSPPVIRNDPEIGDTGFKRVYNQLRRDKQELVV